MTEGRGPLTDAAEERIKERIRAAPRAKDVRLVVIVHDAARVLDDVPGARSTLERNVTQARVDGEIDAVEFVRGSAHVVSEGQEVIDLLELGRLHVIERQRVPAAAGQLRIIRHIEDERI